MIDRSSLFKSVWDSTPRVWGPEYSDDAQAQLRFAIARIDGIIRHRPEFSCVVTFGWVPLDSITVTDPERWLRVKPGGYPKLVETLCRDSRTGSVPLSIASMEDRSHRILWDGHHRLESYRKALRTALPAWLANFQIKAGGRPSPSTSETGQAEP